MKSFKTFALLFVAFFSLRCSQPDAKIGQIVIKENKKNGLAEKLDTYFQSLIDTTNIPGITVAVTHNDSIIYSGGFGVKKLGAKEIVQPTDIFHVASVSKAFTATAVVQLAENGKIDLDEKLTTYLPYFKLDDPRYRDITIKQMLNHTSGFPDVEDYEWDKPQFDEGAAERYVKSLDHEKLVSKPGSEFHYSNMAFDVLADVVSKVSRQSFEKYIKEHILLPLEMTESSFYQPEIKESLRTSPHTGTPPVVSPIYPYNRCHAPSSTLNSNVIELAHWAIANLNGATYKGKHLLSAASFKMMTTPTFVINKENNRAVGLSWFTGTYKDVSLIMHSGSDLGYRSNFTLMPTQKIGIVLLSNYDKTPVSVINFKIMDILLEEYSK